jgi:hypothetical protein
MKQVINVRIIVTFSLVVLFFSGGVFLDYTSSKRWIELSPNVESNLAVVEFAKKVTDNLSSSAKVLYDFAKITLGVLLTLLAASNTVARASNQSTERLVQRKHDETTLRTPPYSEQIKENIGESGSGVSHHDGT